MASNFGCAGCWAGVGCWACAPTDHHGAPASAADERAMKSRRCMWTILPCGVGRLPCGRSEQGPAAEQRRQDLRHPWGDLERGNFRLPHEPDLEQLRRIRPQTAGDRCRFERGRDIRRPIAVAVVDDVVVAAEDPDEAREADEHPGFFPE